MNDNKKIIFNTIVLYGKLAITTIFGLVSSRYILLSLGSSDFGLYSVVGGIVTFLNVIGVTMVSTSYRFLGVACGGGDVEKLRKIYSSLTLIHWLLAFFLIIIGEIAGVYYINHYLVIASDKLLDARFVFHISLLTAAISVINVPANGLTIVREKFVFTSIVEIIISCIKLVLVVLLLKYSGNKLRLFVIIMLSLQVITTLSYQIYCKIYSGNIVHFKFYRRIQDYKDIMKFSAWSLLGASSYIGNNQGSAIILNLFYGTTLNAAYGIASQVNSYANTYIRGITQAVVPQIMKSYGAGNEDRTLNLVYIICRISSLAILIILVPLIFYTDEILLLWLKEPPVYASSFVRLLMASLFLSVMGSGFDSCIQSTGKIKKNEIFYSVVCLIQLPIMYFAYKMGGAPYFNVLLLCFSTLLLKLYQIGLLKRITAFDMRKYYKECIVPVFITTLSSSLPILLVRNFHSFSSRELFIFFIIHELWIIISIYLFGLKKYERAKIVDYVNRIIKVKKL